MYKLRPLTATQGRVSVRALLLVLLLVLVSACSTTGTVERPREDAPAWSTTPLQDVRTGESFRIADLAGKVVVIEPMAIWCTTCRTQQREAAAALARLPGESVTYISLDVDPNEQDADLANYANQQGFDWRFVVASRDVARSLVDSFGPQVLSPPSTPSIVVTPAGDVQPVSFGVKSADRLYAELSELLP
jgi:thiol-disulfide isomerase/thioredoxin